MITRLRLRNFRRFREASTTLLAGANLIEGLNNAGKTSLFYAIEYALFGRVENFKSIRALIQPGKKSLGVEMVFTGIGGESYLLQRIHAAPPKSKKALDGHFTLKAVLADGEKYLLASDFGDTEDALALKLQELTGITRRLFSLAIHMRQGEIASILNGSRQLDIVLGVTAASMAEEELRQMALELEKESAGLAVIDERLRSIGNELATIRTESQSLVVEKQATQQKLSSLVAGPSASAKANSLVTITQSALDAFEKAKNVADRARGRLADLIEQQSQAGKGQSLEAIDHELEKLVVASAARVEETESTRAGLVEVAAELQKLTQSRGDLAGRIDRRKSLPKGKGAKCEVCGGAINATQLAKETAEWNDEIARIDGSITEWKTKQSALQQQLDQSTASERSEFEVRTQLTRQKAQIVELSESVKKRQNEAEEAIAAESTALEAARHAATNLIDTMAHEAPDVPYSIDGEPAEFVSGVRHAIQALRQALAERTGRQAAERKALADLCQRIDGQLDAIQKRQSSLEREQAGAEVEANSQRQKAARAARFRKISAAFKDLQVQIRSEAATRLSADTLEIHRQLSDRDEFQSLTIDPNSYAVQVIPRDLGEEVPASLYEGGGHRMLLGLAFRLAVARMVGQRPFILLDEPTDGLDKPHREALLKRIVDPAFSDQVLLITHDTWDDAQMHRVRLKRQDRETVVEN